MHITHKCLRTHTHIHKVIYAGVLQTLAKLAFKFYYHILHFGY